jgi:hypothetical protein
MKKSVDSFKFYPVDLWLVSFLMQSQCIHWLPCDKIDGDSQKELSTYPLDMVWICCLKNHNEITIYSLVESPFAPSENNGSLLKRGIDCSIDCSQFFE